LKTTYQPISVGGTNRTLKGVKNICK